MTPEQLEALLMEQNRTLGRLEAMGQNTLQTQKENSHKLDSIHGWVNNLDDDMDDVKDELKEIKDTVSDQAKKHEDHTTDWMIHSPPVHRVEKPIWSWKKFWKDWNVVIWICGFLGLPGTILVYNIIVWWLKKLPILPVPR